MGRLSNKVAIITRGADVTKEAAVQNYVAQTKEKYGPIDVFFNNAGILGKMNHIVDMPVEEIRESNEH